MRIFFLSIICAVMYVARGSSGVNKTDTRENRQKEAQQNHLEDSIERCYSTKPTPSEYSSHLFANESRKNPQTPSSNYNLITPLIDAPRPCQRNNLRTISTPKDRLSSTEYNIVNNKKHLNYKNYLSLSPYKSLDHQDLIDDTQSYSNPLNKIVSRKSLGEQELDNLLRSRRRHAKINEVMLKKKKKTEEDKFKQESNLISRERRFISPNLVDSEKNVDSDTSEFTKNNLKDNSILKKSNNFQADYEGDDDIANQNILEPPAVWQVQDDISNDLNQVDSSHLNAPAQEDSLISAREYYKGGKIPLQKMSRRNPNVNLMNRKYFLSPKNNRFPFQEKHYRNLESVSKYNMPMYESESPFIQSSNKLSMKNNYQKRLNNPNMFHQYQRGLPRNSLAFYLKNKDHRISDILSFKAHMHHDVKDVGKAFRRRNHLQDNSDYLKFPELISHNKISVDNDPTLGQSVDKNINQYVNPINLISNDLKENPDLYNSYENLLDYNQIPNNFDKSRNPFQDYTEYNEVDLNNDLDILDSNRIGNSPLNNLDSDRELGNNDNKQLSNMDESLINEPKTNDIKLDLLDNNINDNYQLNLLKDNNYEDIIPDSTITNDYSLNNRLDYYLPELSQNDNINDNSFPSVKLSSSVKECSIADKEKKSLSRVIDPLSKQLQNLLSTIKKVNENLIKSKKGEEENNSEMSNIDGSLRIKRDDQIDKNLHDARYKENLISNEFVNLNAASKDIINNISISNSTLNNTLNEIRMFLDNTGSIVNMTKVNDDKKNEYAGTVKNEVCLNTTIAFIPTEATTQKSSFIDKITGSKGKENVLSMFVNIFKKGNDSSTVIPTTTITSIEHEDFEEISEKSFPTNLYENDYQPSQLLVNNQDEIIIKPCQSKELFNDNTITPVIDIYFPIRIKDGILENVRGHSLAASSSSLESKVNYALENDNIKPIEAHMPPNFYTKRNKIEKSNHISIGRSLKSVTSEYDANEKKIRKLIRRKLRKIMRNKLISHSPSYERALYTKVDVNPEESTEQKHLIDKYFVSFKDLPKLDLHNIVGLEPTDNGLVVHSESELKKMQRRKRMTDINEVNDYDNQMHSYLEAIRLLNNSNYDSEDSKQETDSTGTLDLYHKGITISEMTSMESITEAPLENASTLRKFLNLNAFHPAKFTLGEGTTIEITHLTATEEIETTKMLESIDHKVSMTEYSVNNLNYDDEELKTSLKDYGNEEFTTILFREKTDIPKQTIEDLTSISESSTIEGAITMVDTITEIPTEIITTKFPISSTQIMSSITSESTEDIEKSSATSIQEIVEAETTILSTESTVSETMKILSEVETTRTTPMNNTTIEITTKSEEITGTVSDRTERINALTVEIFESTTEELPTITQTSRETSFQEAESTITTSLETSTEEEISNSTSKYTTIITRRESTVSTTETETEFSTSATVENKTEKSTGTTIEMEKTTGYANTIESTLFFDENWITNRDVGISTELEDIQPWQILETSTTNTLENSSLADTTIENYPMTSTIEGFIIPDQNTKMFTISEGPITLRSTVSTEETTNIPGSTNTDLLNKITIKTDTEDYIDFTKKDLSITTLETELTSKTKEILKEGAEPKFKTTIRVENTSEVTEERDYLVERTEFGKDFDTTYTALLTDKDKTTTTSLTDYTTLNEQQIKSTMVKLETVEDISKVFEHSTEEITKFKEETSINESTVKIISNMEKSTLITSEITNLFSTTEIPISSEIINTEESTLISNEITELFFTKIGSTKEEPSTTVIPISLETISSTKESTLISSEITNLFSTTEVPISSETISSITESTLFNNEITELYLTKKELIKVEPSTVRIPITPDSMDINLKNYLPIETTVETTDVPETILVMLNTKSEEEQILPIYTTEEIPKLPQIFTPIITFTLPLVTSVPQFTKISDDHYVQLDVFYDKEIADKYKDYGDDEAEEEDDETEGPLDKWYDYEEEETDVWSETTVETIIKGSTIIIAEAEMTTESPKEIVPLVKTTLQEEIETNTINTESTFKEITKEEYSSLLTTSKELIDTKHTVKENIEMPTTEKYTATTTTASLETIAFSEEFTSTLTEATTERLTEVFETSTKSEIELLMETTYPITVKEYTSSPIVSTVTALQKDFKEETTFEELISTERLFTEKPTIEEETISMEEKMKTINYGTTEEYTLPPTKGFTLFSTEPLPLDYEDVVSLFLGEAIESSTELILEVTLPKLSTSEDSFSDALLEVATPITLSKDLVLETSTLSEIPEGETTIKEFKINIITDKKETPFNFVSSLIELDLTTASELTEKEEIMKPTETIFKTTEENLKLDFTMPFTSMESQETLDILKPVIISTTEKLNLAFATDSSVSTTKSYGITSIQEGEKEHLIQRLRELEDLESKLIEREQAHDKKVEEWRKSKEKLRKELQNEKIRGRISTISPTIETSTVTTISTMLEDKIDKEIKSLEKEIRIKEKQLQEREKQLQEKEEEFTIERIEFEELYRESENEKKDMNEKEEENINEKKIENIDEKEKENKKMTTNIIKTTPVPVTMLNSIISTTQVPPIEETKVTGKWEKTVMTTVLSIGFEDYTTIEADKKDYEENKQELNIEKPKNELQNKGDYIYDEDEEIWKKDHPEYEVRKVDEPVTAKVCLNVVKNHSENFSDSLLTKKVCLPIIPNSDDRTDDFDSERGRFNRKLFSLNSINTTNFLSIDNIVKKSKDNKDTKKINNLILQHYEWLHNNNTKSLQNTKSYTRLYERWTDIPIKKYITKLTSIPNNNRLLDHEWSEKTTAVIPKLNVANRKLEVENNIKKRNLIHIKHGSDEDRCSGKKFLAIATDEFPPDYLENCDPDIANLNFKTTSQPPLEPETEEYDDFYEKYDKHKENINKQDKEIQVDTNKPEVKDEDEETKNKQGRDDQKTSNYNLDIEYTTDESEINYNDEYNYDDEGDENEYSDYADYDTNGNGEAAKFNFNSKSKGRKLSMRDLSLESKGRVLLESKTGEGVIWPTENAAHFHVGKIKTWITEPPKNNDIYDRKKESFTVNVLHLEYDEDEETHKLKNIIPSSDDLIIKESPLALNKYDDDEENKKCLKKEKENYEDEILEDITENYGPNLEEAGLNSDNYEEISQIGESNEKPSTQRIPPGFEWPTEREYKYHVGGTKIWEVELAGTPPTVSKDSDEKIYVDNHVSETTCVHVIVDKDKFSDSSKFTEPFQYNEKQAPLIVESLDINAAENYEDLNEWNAPTEVFPNNFAKNRKRRDLEIEHSSVKYKNSLRKSFLNLLENFPSTLDPLNNEFSDHVNLKSNSRSLKFAKYNDLEEKDYKSGDGNYYSYYEYDDDDSNARGNRMQTENLIDNAYIYPKEYSEYKVLRSDTAIGTSTMRTNDSKLFHRYNKNPEYASSTPWPIEETVSDVKTEYYNETCALSTIFTTTNKNYQYPNTDTLLNDQIYYEVTETYDKESEITKLNEKNINSKEKSIANNNKSSSKETKELIFDINVTTPIIIPIIDYSEIPDIVDKETDKGGALDLPNYTTKSTMTLEKNKINFIRNSTKKSNAFNINVTEDLAPNSNLFNYSIVSSSPIKKITSGSLRGKLHSFQKAMQKAGESVSTETIDIARTTSKQDETLESITAAKSEYPEDYSDHNENQRNESISTSTSYGTPMDLNLDAVSNYTLESLLVTERPSLVTTTRIPETESTNWMTQPNRLESSIKDSMSSEIPNFFEADKIDAEVEILNKLPKRIYVIYKCSSPEIVADYGKNQKSLPIELTSSGESIKDVTECKLPFSTLGCKPMGSANFSRESTNKQATTILEPLATTAMTSNTVTPVPLQTDIDNVYGWTTTSMNTSNLSNTNRNFYSENYDEKNHKKRCYRFVINMKPFNDENNEKQDLTFSESPLQLKQLFNFKRNDLNEKEEILKTKSMTKITNKNFMKSTMFKPAVKTSKPIKKKKKPQNKEKKTITNKKSKVKHSLKLNKRNSKIISESNLKKINLSKIKPKKTQKLSETFKSPETNSYTDLSNTYENIKHNKRNSRIKREIRKEHSKLKDNKNKNSINDDKTDALLAKVIKMINLEYPDQQINLDENLVSLNENIDKTQNNKIIHNKPHSLLEKVKKIINSALSKFKQHEPSKTNNHETNEGPVNNLNNLKHFSNDLNPKKVLIGENNINLLRSKSSKYNEDKVNRDSSNTHFTNKMLKKKALPKKQRIEKLKSNNNKSVHKKSTAKIKHRSWLNLQKKSQTDKDNKRKHKSTLIKVNDVIPVIKELVEQQHLGNVEKIIFYVDKSEISKVAKPNQNLIKRQERENARSKQAKSPKLDNNVVDYSSPSVKDQSSINNDMLNGIIKKVVDEIMQSHHFNDENQYIDPHISVKVIQPIAYGTEFPHEETKAEFMIDLSQINSNDLLHSNKENKYNIGTVENNRKRRLINKDSMRRMDLPKVPMKKRNNWLNKIGRMQHDKSQCEQQKPNITILQHESLKELKRSLKEIEKNNHKSIRKIKRMAKFPNDSKITQDHTNNGIKERIRIMYDMQHENSKKNRINSRKRKQKNRIIEDEEALDSGIEDDISFNNLPEEIIDVNLFRDKRQELLRANNFNDVNTKNLGVQNNLQKINQMSSIAKEQDLPNENINMYDENTYDQLQDVNKDENMYNMPMDMYNQLYLKSKFKRSENKDLTTKGIITSNLRKYTEHQNEKHSAKDIQIMAEKIVRFANRIAVQKKKNNQIDNDNMDNTNFNGIIDKFGNDELGLSNEDDRRSLKNLINEIMDVQKNVNTTLKIIQEKLKKSNNSSAKEYHLKEGSETWVANQLKYILSKMTTKTKDNNVSNIIEAKNNMKSALDLLINSPYNVNTINHENSEKRDISFKNTSRNKENKNKKLNAKVKIISNKLKNKESVKKPIKTSKKKSMKKKKKIKAKKVTKSRKKSKNKTNSGSFEETKIDKIGKDIKKILKEESNFVKPDRFKKSSNLNYINLENKEKSIDKINLVPSETNQREIQFVKPYNSNLKRNKYNFGRKLLQISEGFWDDYDFPLNETRTNLSGLSIGRHLCLMKNSHKPKKKKDIKPNKKFKKSSKKNVSQSKKPMRNYKKTQEVKKHEGDKLSPKEDHLRVRSDPVSVQKRKKKCLNCICDIGAMLDSLKDLLEKMNDPVTDISTFDCDTYEDIGTEIILFGSEPKDTELQRPKRNFQKPRNQKYVKPEEIENVLSEEIQSQNEYEILSLPGYDINIPCSKDRDDITWISSSNKPNYVWKRSDGTSVSGFVRKNGDLELYDVDAEDSGNYSCQLSYVDRENEDSVENIYETSVQIVTLPIYTLRGGCRYRIQSCDDINLEALGMYFPQKLKSIICRRNICDAYVLPPYCYREQISINTLIMPSQINKLVQVGSRHCGLHCRKAIQDKIALLLSKNLKNILGRPRFLIENISWYQLRKRLVQQEEKEKKILIILMTNMVKLVCFLAVLRDTACILPIAFLASQDLIVKMVYLLVKNVPWERINHIKGLELVVLLWNSSMLMIILACLSTAIFLIVLLIWICYCSKKKTLHKTKGTPDTYQEEIEMQPLVRDISDDEGEWYEYEYKPKKKKNMNAKRKLYKENNRKKDHEVKIQQYEPQVHHNKHKSIKTNWKPNSGYQLDIDDVDSYRSHKDHSGISPKRLYYKKPRVPSPDFDR